MKSPKVVAFPSPAETIDQLKARRREVEAELEALSDRIAEQETALRSDGLPRHTGQYSLARHILRTFQHAGAQLPTNPRILDFGCGEGGLVYEFRDYGFDAYGFDIHDRVKYRTSSDRKHFGFSHNGEVSTCDTRIKPGVFHIPFPDGYFDAVVSTSVIEHVMDFETVSAEISRVTRKGGYVLHLYPDILVPIEPHILVPFGGLCRHPLWLYLWAILGVRHWYQEGMGAVETARHNIDYCRTGLAYRSRRTLHRIMRKTMSEVQDASQAWLGEWRPPTKRELWKEACKQKYPLRAFAPQVPLHAVLGTR